MAATLESLRTNIEAAVEKGFRHRLLARGQSRGMVWREGVLPPEAPNFSADLTEDLLSYGYSLLLHGLRYLELGGDSSLARTAFEVAGEALESVVARGGPDGERGFHRVVAAAAYHLGRFSARAYSLLHKDLAGENLSPTEKILAKLMLRDLDGLTGDVASWSQAGLSTDDALIDRLAGTAVGEVGTDGESEEDPFLEVLTSALQGNFLGAVATALLAFERGDEAALAESKQLLENGLGVAAELSLVTQWWCHRLAVQLLDGLWETSFHKILPVAGPPGTGTGDWLLLRRLFVSSLYRRRKSELELWPSQLDAAGRVLDYDSSLVLSLPTSAGKTRIAELCILACLSQKKRVVFVTPLRALSAQTEVGLRRTFGPLGKSVSSLYGSIGVSGTDIDALRSQHIVVATPEKLDFALRSDPALLDDVGLVVLDEGHMIGLNEREVRYEAQIQRLLRRSDAATRRIVCLSAILPEGDQLEDFSAWLTRDQPDGLIKGKWRPTRLRFGEVNWTGEHAQLNVVVGDETPFVPRFIVGKKPTKGRAKKVFPSDQRELCIATAWRLIDDGQTVLIFCPLRRSVLPFAKCIIEMHKRGHIDSVLGNPLSVLESALSVGAEWFGADHELLECLKLGVAVHHGALPAAYRKEVERLLRDGILKVTVSSPTLAQGLNLSATGLIFHSLTRDRETIDVSEFRNVVGRAGRAYVDLEGLVLYPMYDDHWKRRAAWQALIASDKGREMESGLVRLLAALLLRMRDKLKEKDLGKLVEYVAGQGGWDFPVLPHESAEQSQAERAKWYSHLASLDTAIFSLLGDEEVQEAQVETKLDEVLTSSLFHRRLARYNEVSQVAMFGGLAARARHIWTTTTAQQRRGYFLAGVGLATGLKLDEKAQELEELLMRANSGIELEDKEVAVQAITAFAEIALAIPPFAPKSLMGRWKQILRMWLLGEAVTEIEAEDSDDVISFIEQVFVYNLPWAMEAIRVRAAAHEVPSDDVLALTLTLSDFSRAHAVAALETGTLVVPAATLIQAGFSSRLAAIKAVEDTGATFDSMSGMTAWLRSEQVKALSTQPDWPTKDTHLRWLDFIEPNLDRSVGTWKVQAYSGKVKWHGPPMPPGRALRLGGGAGKERAVFTADYREVGTLLFTPNPKRAGVVIATATGAPDTFDFEYVGPDDLFEV
jgi:superfamily II DNA/RNA helicase